jgi:ADP-ribose pyrophosphatase
MSPWFTVVEKDVDFPWSDGVQTYHALQPLPYVAVVAITPDDRMPLIRQYRPAIEEFTWELPAGLIDDGETAAVTCRRELKEETGLSIRSLVSLGSYAIDPGRVDGIQHLFLAHCTMPASSFVPEVGTELIYISTVEASQWISSGRITGLAHVAAIYLAQANGLTPEYSPNS